MRFRRIRSNMRQEVSFSTRREFFLPFAKNKPNYRIPAVAQAEKIIFVQCAIYLTFTYLITAAAGRSLIMIFNPSSISGRPEICFFSPVERLLISYSASGSNPRRRNRQPKASLSGRRKAWIIPSCACGRWNCQAIQTFFSRL